MLLTPASGLAQRPEVFPCPGNWKVTSGAVTGETQGQRLPIRPGGEQETVRIEVIDCGHTLRVIAGRTVQLNLHSLESRTYSGAMAFGGVQRSWRFEVTSSRHMEGAVYAGDGRLAVDKPMSLEFVGGSQSMKIGCDAKAEPAQDFPSRVAHDEAIEAMANVLRSRGLAPPADGPYSYADYIMTGVREPMDREHSDAGTRWVRVFVGHDGQILPNYADRIECRVGKGSLEPPAYILNFKLLRYQDVNDTAIQLIDIETGKIQNQRMGKGGSGQPGMEGAMKDAWNQLQVPIGPMSTGLQGDGD